MNIEVENVKQRLRDLLNASGPRFTRQKCMICNNWSGHLCEIHAAMKLIDGLASTVDQQAKHISELEDQNRKMAAFKAGLRALMD